MSMSKLIDGMKKERNALASGECRAVGKKLIRDPKSKKHGFIGDLEMTIAFSLL